MQKSATLMPWSWGKMPQNWNKYKQNLQLRFGGSFTKIFVLCVLDPCMLLRLSVIIHMLLLYIHAIYRRKMIEIKKDAFKSCLRWKEEEWSKFYLHSEVMEGLHFLEQKLPKLQDIGPLLLRENLFSQAHSSGMLNLSELAKLWDLKQIPGL